MIKSYEINKEYYDEYGRISGIFTYYKKKGEFSHDIVDHFRKLYKTRRVGHAGALDPFAEGLLIILVGKATKLSSDFLNLNKSYSAKILFGVTTDSLDIDGKITDITAINARLDFNTIKVAIQSFGKQYNQRVPVLSSVKVKGEKLRVLARKFDEFKIVNEGKDNFVVKFFKDNKIIKEVFLPVKPVQLYSIELSSVTEVTSKNINDFISKELSEEILKTDNNVKLVVAKINVTCSKGTYIRQLAFDIGEKLGVASMLISLKRESVGEIKVSTDKQE